MSVIGISERSRCPAVMIQGVGSNVGKSVMVAGLCRVFARRGVRVRPFKPQNMSNNAAATPEGGEIGRAQALQALAAGVPPSIHMNPVLLKPETDSGAQVIVQGQRWGQMRARDFGAHKGELLPAVIESFDKISSEAELVIVEGAGSPAEVNLRARDIANMGFAEAVGLPAVIVGDIERGGVIAALVGTHAVLDEADRGRIKGYLINKFRGDTSLFDDALGVISSRTGWAGLGVVPHFPDARLLPAEDILDLSQNLMSQDLVSDVSILEGQVRRVKIAVPALSRIANFDDLDPLKLEPGVVVELVQSGRPLPLDADLILLPGSKSTISDLAQLREEGWDIDIAAHVRRGGHVLGICGGFQMLGGWINDDEGVEGVPGRHRGLGHLDVETWLTSNKVVRPIRGRDLASGAEVAGYEIHLGRTEGEDRLRAMFEIAGEDRAMGAMNASGRIMGSYVHGVFGGDAYRAAFLKRISGRNIVTIAYDEMIDRTLEKLADHLEEFVDIGALMRIAEGR